VVAGFSTFTFYVNSLHSWESNAEKLGDALVMTGIFSLHGLDPEEVANSHKNDERNHGFPATFQIHQNEAKEHRATQDAANDANARCEPKR